MCKWVPLAPREANGYGIPANELDARSVTIWEVAIRVAAAFEAVGIRAEMPPPEVHVTSGSISFSLGGGTMPASGIAFIVASRADLGMSIDAQMFAYWGGGLLSSLSIVDLAVNWTKSKSEIKKTDSETTLNQAKLRLANLEIEKAEIEIQAAKQPASLPTVPQAPAGMLPPAVINAEAMRFGLDPLPGTHLLNRVLPSIAQLTASQSPLVAASSSSGSNSRTASADAS